MSAAPFRLLLASAGTGKTWQLSTHFLGLLLRGEAPERILATTFTRKAAGEIFDRVLGRLVEAIDDERERARLAEALGRPVERDACLQLLARLTRTIERFRIRTLDAWFAQVARTYALDLGLPSEWTIAEEPDDRRLREDALAALLEDASQEEWLELLRALQRDAVSRGVLTRLLETVRAFRDAWLESEPAAWERIRPPAAPDEPLSDLLGAVAALELPATQAGKPNQHWAKARARLAELVGGERWEEVVELGLVGKVLAGEEQFSRKPIDDDARALVERVLAHARPAVIGAVADQNAATRTLLEDFEVHYAEGKRRERALRFEDLPQAIAPDTASGRDAFSERELDLWFRLDGQVDHLLLDEFQDTAPVQWRILRPLASEILADGTGERTFFCVGDVKQSIYGWREAEPRLLGGMAERYPSLATEPLAKNWRSSPAVLTAVDRVFVGLDQSPALADDERAVERGAVERFVAAYEPHTAARELPGVVQLRAARRAGEGERAELLVLELAAERVQALVDDAPGATVGVLLRRRVLIPRLIHLLRARGLLASGEGGNPLTDAAAVQEALSLLLLADHPGDSAAAFHVASSRFAPAFGLGPDDLFPWEERGAARATSVARELWSRLVRDGYGALFASLLPQVEAASGEWDRRRYARLVELAHAYDARAGLRPAELVDLVREQRVEDPSAARVKVMTIHASKGLEFDAVVLPELDQALGRQNPALLRERPDPEGPLTAVSVCPRQSLRALDAELVRLHQVVTAREIEEALCVLYVAMTRARRRLELVIQAPPEEGRKVPLSLAALVRPALEESTFEEAGPGQPMYAHVVGGDWREGLEAPPPSAPDADAEAARGLGLLPPDGSRAAAARSPSAEEGGAARTAVELLRPSDAAARARGSLLHRWLEELVWLEDFAASDAQLHALGRALEPDEDAREEALEELRAALARPAIAALLSRPEDEAGVEREVWRERAFTVLLPRDRQDDKAGDELWTGAIDRVVLRREGGELVSAELIDYKTDRVEGDELARRVEFYRPQLEAYRRVLARVTGLAPERIASRLAFLAAGEVVALDVPGRR